MSETEIEQSDFTREVLAHLKRQMTWLGTEAERLSLSDAIEALIEAKMADMLDEFSDRIEARTGVRP